MTHRPAAILTPLSCQLPRTAVLDVPTAGEQAAMRLVGSRTEEPLVSLYEPSDRPRWIRIADRHLPQRPRRHGGRRRALLSETDECRLLTTWEARALDGAEITVSTMAEDLAAVAGRRPHDRMVLSLLRRHGYCWIGTSPRWRRIGRTIRRSPTARSGGRSFRISATPQGPHDAHPSARDLQRMQHDGRHARAQAMTSTSLTTCLLPDMWKGLGWRSTVLQSALDQLPAGDVPCCAVSRGACPADRITDEIWRLRLAQRHGLPHPLTEAICAADELSAETRWFSPTRRTALLVEALLLCGWNDVEIAQAAGLAADAIRLYHDLYFSVRPFFGRWLLLEARLFPAGCWWPWNRSTRSLVHLWAYQTHDGQLLRALLVGGNLRPFGETISWFRQRLLSTRMVFTCMTTDGPSLLGSGRADMQRLLGAIADKHPSFNPSTRSSKPE